jgi:hypothetical protein
MEQLNSRAFQPAPAREVRGSRLLRGRISSVLTREQTILIRNISPRGLGGSALEQPLPIGVDVTVTLSTAVVTGKVRWSKGKSFGIRLDTEIDLDQLSEAQKGITSNPIGGDWKVRHLHRHEYAEATNRPRRIV